MTEMQKRMYYSQGNNIRVVCKDGKIFDGICDFYIQPLDNEPEVAAICIKRLGYSSLTEITEPEITEIEIIN